MAEASSACVRSDLAPLSLSSASSSSTLSFEYHDLFLGRAVRIPVVHLHQIGAPLIIFKSAFRINAQSNSALHWYNPSSGFSDIHLSAAQRARIMLSLTATVCERLLTDPAHGSSSKLLLIAQRCKRVTLEHVMKGQVFKVQVCFCSL
jgi:hypothetical protein